MLQDIHLSRLQHLLENLPGSLPYRDLEATQYSFSISGEEIGEYGDETSATNRRLEVVFGPRYNTGGIVPIKERGPGICAVVSLLAKCPPADARIELWVENLCSSAEKLYSEAGKKVSVSIITITIRLTRAQLPEITARTSGAGKKRQLSEEVEIVDLVNDDISDSDSVPVNEAFG